MKLDYSPRKHYVEEFVLIDGITRAGKFGLAHVVSSLERVEFFQYPFLLETLLYLHRLGKVDFETCKNLIHVDYDLRVFDSMIGRGLNTRIHDLSQILKVANYDEYLTRAAIEDREILVQRFIADRRMPAFINHEGLANARVLFKIFPRVKIVNILRDPAAVILSWYKRGWGRRLGDDPKAGWTTFSSSKGPVPWWAVSWSKNYNDYSEMDRCVRSIATLSQFAREEYETLDSRSQICFVQFETLVREPEKVVFKLSEFLERAATPATQDILKRERFPRVLAADEHDKLVTEIRTQITSDCESVLSSVCDEYQHYWSKLASSNSPKRVAAAKNPVQPTAG